MAMARTQALVQLTDELVATLDERAARDGVSRSALIRAAVERYLCDDVEAHIDAAIAAAYTRHPATEPDAATLARAAASIDDEPW
jgi:metal-responsive CopG/Arc/MetJ family transcriptional regulator